MKSRQITEAAWMREYIPQARPGVNPDQAAWGGLLYDPDKEEDMKVVKAARDNHIWTLLDCDDKEVIGAGWSYVNRLGYFITENPWPDMGIEVKVSL